MQKGRIRHESCIMHRAQPFRILSLIFILAKLDIL